MYTIDELEKMLSRIPPHIEASDPAVDLARQLLDTLRENARLQARIDAALAIKPIVLDEKPVDTVLELERNIGYNAALADMREALTKGE